MSNHQGPEQAISVVMPFYGDPSHFRAISLPFLKENRSAFQEVVLVNGNPDPIELPPWAEGFVTQVMSEPGRGRQLHVGTLSALGTWFLFLHSDTSLIGNWQRSMADHTAQDDAKPAVFRLTYDEDTPAGWLVGRWGTLRTRLFGVPYGDQGLLISRRDYLAVGGFNTTFPLMEDVDLIARLGGRSGIKLLDGATRTSFEKYRAEGWLRRGAKH